MKPIKFKESNSVYGADQNQYMPLPCCVRADITDTNKIVTSCWRLTLKERIKVIFTGKIFVSILTCNQPLQPQRLTTGFEATK
jgi:hypothetical protein